MRLKVRKTGLNTYPDVVVVCGAQRFNDLKQDTLLNSTLIIEVLSSTTERVEEEEEPMESVLLLLLLVCETSLT